jgi:hypothetical protein
MSQEILTRLLSHNQIVKGPNENSIKKTIFITYSMFIVWGSFLHADKRIHKFDPFLPKNDKITAP